MSIYVRDAEGNRRKIAGTGLPGSMGKSAYQYAVEGGFVGTEDAFRALMGVHSNPNLLDNWYLADPINQRNQTEYTERGYAIDRWVLAQGELVLQEGRTLLQKNAIIYQALDTPEKYVGKQMSASVLLSDNTLISVSGVMSHTSHVESKKSGTTVFMGAVIGFGLTFPVVCIGTDPENPVIPQAVKLELGPVQTLAHKEGNTWVLNDPPPNRALELAKCQRYFFKTTDHFISYSVEGRPTQYVSAPLPVTMRANPVITGLTYAPDMNKPEASGWANRTSSILFQCVNGQFQVTGFSASADL